MISAKPAMLAVLLLLAAAPACAGPYSDDMGRCLVSSTSVKDKTDLVRWIFANAALHPDVGNIASVSAKERESINRLAGGLVERLLTDTCRKQTQDALRYEGQIALQLSFQVLGQVAMQELMSNPAVGKGFGELDRFMDQKKIRALIPQAK